MNMRDGIPTVEEINKAAIEAARNGGKLEEYEVDPYALHRMKAQYRQDQEEYLLKTKPRPPITGHTNGISGGMFGLFARGYIEGGSSRQYDHHAPEYLRQLADWQERWDEFQNEDWRNKELTCVTISGPVKLIPRKNHNKCEQHVEQDSSSR